MNRYGRPIGFRFHIRAGFPNGELVAESGTVIWLPPTTEIIDHQAIELLLRERYGVLKEDAPPLWLAQYTLPTELPIIQRIEKIQSESAELSRKLEHEQEDLQDASRLKKLLYETGEGVLEPIVREALALLGAVIQLPKERGREDGRLSDPNGRQATLEIKGRTGPLRLDDVRQAHQWVADSLTYESRQSKGILIANLNKDTDPKNRGEVFPKNCIELAQNFQISLVTTSQIFRALVMLQEGTFDQPKFWDTIFETNGVCALPDIT